MNRSDDPVDAALARLRADDRLAIPDPACERRLLARCTRVASARSRHRWAATLLLGFVLAGAAGAAVVGIDGLKRWWYAITVDGATVGETLDGDGARHHEFTASGGVRVTVHVQRRVRDDRGVETAIAVTEQSPVHLTQQEIETVSGGAEKVERAGMDALAHADALHAWTDARGRRCTLYLAPDPDAAGGSRLLVRDESDHAERPILVLARVSRPLGAGAHVEVIENEQGGIRVILDDGHGWMLEIARGPGGPAAPPEVVTPDGHVRVKVGP